MCALLIGFTAFIGPIVQAEVIANDTNLALGAPVVASSVEVSASPAINAVDGNASSRWSSEFSDSEWIYVDLSAIYTIERVVLNWETAYGKAYEIQVSDDTLNWVTVFSNVNGAGGIEDLTFAPVSARYVRVMGVQRGTRWGYSLWEFEVYGASTPSEPQVVTVVEIPTPPGNLALGAPVVASSVEKSGASAVNAVDGDASSRWSSAFSDPQWIYVDLSADYTIDRVKLNWESAYGKAYEIQVSNDAQKWAPVFSEDNGDGGADDLTFAPVNARYVRVIGLQRGTQWGYSLWEFEVYGTSTPSEPQVVTVVEIPTPPGNLALGAPVVASSVEKSGASAVNAVDGDASSRWSSKFSDPQWLYVDLNTIYTIERVVLNWETAYGETYEIQVSDDAKNWVTVFTEYNSDGGIDDRTFAAPVNARYVRVMGLKRGTLWSYSLWEFEVYGVGSSTETWKKSPLCTLPYDKPPVESLRRSNKKVFAHYFSPYPLSIGNRHENEDYYTKHYLNPEGEDGKFAYCGGFLRDRTLPPAPYASGIDWGVENMKIEVERAIAIGLDGFSFDVLDPFFSSINGKRLKQLLKAASQVDPDFLIQLVPDMHAGSFSGTDADILNAFTTLLDAVGSHPSVQRLSDGRIVLAPFLAEKKSAAFWNWLLNKLDNKGHKVALMPMTLGAYVGNAAKFEDVPVFGVASWGGRSMNAASLLSKDASYVKGKNLVWMAPVAPQDSRPKNLSFMESDNSASFRAQWDAVISGDADWVQLVTWNDYSENSHIAPSAKTGNAFSGLSSYYITWFKSGVPPEIQRDALYYFHRAHSLDSSVAPPDLSLQREPFKGVNGPSDATNEIELVALLTTPGTLEVTIGGSTYRKEVQSGLQSFRVPIKEGTPVFRLKRSGRTIIELQSHTPINNTIDYQDPLYHAGCHSLSQNTMP